jgi:guanyl-specific ribonuclease Sa
VPETTTKNKIGEKSLEELPQSVQDSYKKYGIDGWKGPRPDQTPGTRGGRIYKNYDKTLPQTDGEGNNITYREFDVNNKIEGQNRDAERFIIGSDGSIYYTNDHYQTFIKIRGE